MSPRSRFHERIDGTQAASLVRRPEGGRRQLGDKVLVGDVAIEYEVHASLIHLPVIARSNCQDAFVCDNFWHP